MVQPRSIGEKGGLHVYSFTRNLPIMLHDAYGLQGCSDSAPQVVYQFSGTLPTENFTWWTLKDYAFENHALTYKCNAYAKRQVRYYNETITFKKYKVHTVCDFNGVMCERNRFRLEYDNFCWVGSQTDDLVRGRYVGDHTSP